MRSEASRLARSALYAVATVLIGYLILLARWPWLRDEAPLGLRWFGEPGSWPSIAIGAVLLAAVALLVFRSPGARRPGAPLALVAGLGLLSVLIGLMSYWSCYDDAGDPRFFRPLMWTASLVKGSIDDHAIDGQTCPSPTPVALEIARLSALAAIFLSVVGVATALFQSRLDRLRVHFARSVTAIVDMDDDSQSMVNAVARQMNRSGTLAVLTANPDRPCVQEVRANGARVVTVDFTRPETIRSLSLWRKLNGLYLLSADPSGNLLRLRTITKRLDEVGKRQRLPLIVRIDDPWQAEAWRAQHFGGSETRWAADAVGKYEVTANQLLDRIIGRDDVRRILICGTSRLTLALCSDLAQRQLEYDYYSAPDDPALPTVMLVAEHADEYRQDLAHARSQYGSGGANIEAVPKAPTVQVLSTLLADGSDPAKTAVILVDADGTTGPAVDVTTGTRLAARFPTTPIHAWDPAAEVTEDRLSIVGRLRTFRLTMDLPGGQAQDAWERAARLIHNRYAAEAGHQSAASVPWSDLDEFYRDSNRRQVRNALWMVERIGGHTWNVWNSPDNTMSITNLRGREPLEQLRLMGFDRDAAMGMAQAEHEDWCRYYRKHKWRYGTPRDNTRKIHDKLVDWEVIKADPALLNTALSSLSTTLARLRELGYRSAPAISPWQSFRRTGTVVAEQRDEPWSWTTHSGETAQAQAGDWLVRDASDPDDGRTWSVRDDIFRATYTHIDGDTWGRHGTVSARPARVGEVIATLEGPVTAAEGDWVVRGEHGEQWPVPADEFASRYAPRL